ncbi:MAG: carbohydrate ABC transporter substrate-binding protein, partial [Acidimicrobiia bacterium]
YLRTAGPEKYDQLAAHEIPWTDDSVKQALAILGELIGVEENVALGLSGATEVSFLESVRLVFSENPQAAVVYEADFVAGVILSDTTARPGADFDFFPWPSIDGSPPAVVGGGDVAVVLRNSPGAMQLISYLATPGAAEIWAALGGFSSPNKAVDPSLYPDDITRASAVALANADVFRFDLSDLVPARLGSTAAAGIWGRLQDWLNDPDDIDGITARLEEEARAAFRD